MRSLEHGLRLAVCLAGLVCRPAWAQDTSLGPLEISDGWITATDKPGNALAYFVVRNHGDEEWLLGTSCAGAYGTTMNEPHPRKAFLEGLEPLSTDQRPVMVKVKIPANGQLVFKPGGNFLMLQDVRWALQAGRRVDCTLFFQVAGPVAMQFVVIAGAPPPAAP